ncbi:MAG: PilN domain-containing protein [Candidatus Omnitrophica bacterium]|nr:PilN domain-containing protein [Candidatus Omnitrophota bacterium]
MKTKKNHTIFICQITESALKVLKCVNGAKRTFSGSAVEPLPSEKNDAALTDKIKSVFNKLGYANNPIIVCLPRNNATIRYLKVPTQDPEEIEKISSLQASKYLPYLAHELITGYELIENDQQGYAQINLVIAHKEIIERYLRIFSGFEPEGISLAMSSFGLANLFSHIEPGYRGAVTAVDIDGSQAEITVISAGKLLFSRYARINFSNPGWENFLAEEINKTKNAYLKEVEKETPGKTVLFSMEKSTLRFASLLGEHKHLSIELLPYADKLLFGENVSSNLSGTDHSFAGLIGLGLKDFEQTINLLPQGLKTEKKKVFRQKETLRLSAFILAIILTLSLAVANNLNNKTAYLKRLEAELNKMSAQAKPLEEIEKRTKLLERRSKKTQSSLDILSAVSQALPDQIFLSDFSYEENNQAVLRGQAEVLNSVFDFTSRLEKLPEFRNFNIKVRYATQRKTQTGDIVDFEITCLKRK